MFCVLSSLHMSVELGESEKKKLDTMEFYNKTKCDVDMADQMLRQYSVKAGTRRVARWCFIQHCGFGRHQCICAL